MLGQVIELDHVINSLIGSLSATEQPPLTTIYNTADPATYDTLLPTYGPRHYPVVLPTNHEPYPTMAQRYATMNVLQQPDYSLAATVDTEFRLHNHIHPDEYASAMRYNGSVYPIPSLYNMHQGTQPGAVSVWLFSVCSSVMLSFVISIPLQIYNPMQHSQTKSIVVYSRHFWMARSNQTCIEDECYQSHSLIHYSYMWTT